MELIDIIYNILLLFGIFLTGFFSLGFFLSRSNKKDIEKRLSHISEYENVLYSTDSVNVLQNDYSNNYSFIKENYVRDNGNHRSYYYPDRAQYSTPRYEYN